MGRGRYKSFRRNRNTLASKLGHFFAEMPRVKHHAVANYRERTAHNARWKQREFIDIIADNQRMPGIMPALKTNDNIGTAGKPIDDLTLALVTPLCADYRYVCQSIFPFA